MLSHSAKLLLRVRREYREYSNTFHNLRVRGQDSEARVWVPVLEHLHQLRERLEGRIQRLAAR